MVLRPKKRNATASNRSAYSSQTATVTSNIEGLNGSSLVLRTASSGDALQAPLQGQCTSTIVQKRALKRKLDPPSRHCTDNSNEHSQSKKSKGEKPSPDALVKTVVNDHRRVLRQYKKFGEEVKSLSSKIHTILSIIAKQVDQSATNVATKSKWL